MPQPTPSPPPNPNTMHREVFQAFARADDRDTLMGLMRRQAEAYFGCKVTLKDANVQHAPANADPPLTYQGSSRWAPRP